MAFSSLARCFANVSVAFSSLLPFCGLECFTAMSVGRADIVLPACSIEDSSHFRFPPKGVLREAAKSILTSVTAVCCDVDVDGTVLSLDPADVPCCSTAGSTKLES